MGNADSAPLGAFPEAIVIQEVCNSARPVAEMYNKHRRIGYKNGIALSDHNGIKLKVQRFDIEVSPGRCC